MESVDLQVLAAARQWAVEGRRFVLVTVARTWGSAPRPPGSWLALREDGRVEGSVSGGCIEDDLIARMHDGRMGGLVPFKLVYGVTQEEATRFGLPCGGTLELVVEPAPDVEALEELARCLARRLLVLRQVDLANGSVQIVHARRGEVMTWDGERLTTVHGPQWRLLIVGAGQISQYLARMAQALDYDITVSDPREAYGPGWDVPGTRLVTTMPDDTLLAMEPDARLAVVALTHDPKLDDMVLLEALRSSAFYVGALGSHHNNVGRRERLAQHFDFSDEELLRLHGPIGLPIGSHTPPEIAVSILAEMTAVRNGAAIAQGDGPAALHVAEHAASASTPPTLSIKRRMGGRDIHESHRASSPLELLFDLTVVVAVAAAASRLHHDIAHGQYLQATLDLGLSFFAVWWSWMNFTWFSSAYDTDDIGYRLVTVVQMVGVLIIGAGLTQGTMGQLTATLGYTVMRVGLVGLWLRAAREHPERRASCHRYAASVTALQVLWLLRVLVLQTEWALPSFILLAVLELMVPVHAERAGETPWHPHHIAERYALFTIILLGECVVGAGNTINSVLQTQGWSIDLIVVSFSLAGLIVGLWWTYFLVPFAQVLHLRRERAFLWGYCHALIFIVLAALNGILEVVADVFKEGVGHAVEGAHAGPSSLLAIGLTAAAVMVFLATLWWLGGRTTRRAERSPMHLVPTALVAGIAVAAVAFGLSLSWGLLLLNLAPALLIAGVMRKRHAQPERFAVQ